MHSACGSYPTQAFRHHREQLDVDCYEAPEGAPEAEISGITLSYATAGPQIAPLSSSGRLPAQNDVLSQGWGPGGPQRGLPGVPGATNRQPVSALNHYAPPSTSRQCGATVVRPPAGRHCRETRWFGMHKQAGTTAGNQQRHPRTMQ